MLPQKNRSLYREMMRSATKTAWHERRWWLLALIAGILQTGGIYDVLLRFAYTLPAETRLLLTRPAAFLPTLLTIFAPASTSFQRHMIAAHLVEGLLVGGLGVAAIITCSLVAQGALVFGLGTRLGRFRNLSACLAVGARHLWSVLALNVMSLGLLWVARFVLLIPLTRVMIAPSVPLIIGSVIGFLIFADLAMALVTTHLFALQAIVLDDLSTLDAIRHAYQLFRRSWLIIIEGAGALLLMGVAFFLIALGVFLIASIPLVILLATAATLQLWSIVWFAVWVGLGLLSVILILCGAFTITFQYAAWHELYKRVNTGVAISKLWRLVHGALLGLQRLAAP